MKLRLGIVGCGDIARYVALFGWLNWRIRLVACCDVVPERAAAFAHRYRIPQHFSNYEQMLAAVSLDAVYLAVPHHLHLPMVQTAVAHGVHVFLEKPITRTLAEGRTLLPLIRQSGVCVGVNYQYRYDSGCYALARAVQRGDLGPVHAARCNLPWHRQQDYFGGASWHAAQATAGGGTLLTQGSHLLDVVLWAMGKRPSTATGYTAQRKFRDVDVEDLAQGIIEMEDGALVQISSAMVAATEQAVTIEIYGERGTAVYSNRPWPRVTFRGVRVRKEKPPHWGVHALQRSLEGFRAWVIDGRPYLTPAAEALPVLAAVEAIYRAAASGKREIVAPWQVTEAAT